MAVRYIPYFPDTLEGQALLDNFVRTKRVLRYRDNDRVIDRIVRGMPYYETDLRERVGTKKPISVSASARTPPAIWLSKANVFRPAPT